MAEIGFLQQAYYSEAVDEMERDNNQRQLEQEALEAEEDNESNDAALAVGKRENSRLWEQAEHEALEMRPVVFGQAVMRRRAAAAAAGAANGSGNVTDRSNFSDARSSRQLRMQPSKQISRVDDWLSNTQWMKSFSHTRSQTFGGREVAAGGPAKEVARQGTSTLVSQNMASGYALPLMKLSISRWNRMTNLVGWLDQHVPVMDPYTPRRRLWDMFILAFVVYSAIIVPLDFSYELPRTLALKALGLTIDFLFLCDILLNFRTAYHDNQGHMVRDSALVAKQYCRFWFPIDAAGTMPWDTLAEILGFGNNKQQLTALAFLKTPRLLRLGRLVRLLDRLKNANAFKVLQLVCMMCMAAHWFACIWYTMAKFATSDPTITWTFDTLQDGSKVTYYLSAFYYSFLLMVGNNQPVANNYERVLFIVILFFGAFLYSAVVGNISLLINTMNTVALRHRQKMDTTQDVLRYIGSTENTKKRVQGYFDFITRFSHPGPEGLAFLKELPKGLGEDFARFLHKPTMSKMYLFQSCEPPFVMALMMRMQIVTYTPREIIFREGDLGHEMYIIRKGNVAVVSRKNEVISLLQPGDFFGEIALLTETRRTAKCVALANCDLALLNSSDLRHIMKEFPESAKALQRAAAERLMQLKIAGRAGLEEEDGEDDDGERDGDDGQQADDDDEEEEEEMQDFDEDEDSEISEHDEDGEVGGGRDSHLQGQDDMKLWAAGEGVAAVKGEDTQGLGHRTASGSSSLTISSELRHEVDPQMGNAASAGTSVPPPPPQMAPAPPAPAPPPLQVHLPLPNCSATADTIALTLWDPTRCDLQQHTQHQPQPPASLTRANVSAMHGTCISQQTRQRHALPSSIATATAAQGWALGALAAAATAAVAADASGRLSGGLPGDWAGLQQRRRRPASVTWAASGRNYAVVSTSGLSGQKGAVGGGLGGDCAAAARRRQPHAALSCASGQQRLPPQPLGEGREKDHSNKDGVGHDDSSPYTRPPSQSQHPRYAPAALASSPSAHSRASGGAAGRRHGSIQPLRSSASTTSTAAAAAAYAPLSPAPSGAVPPTAPAATAPSLKGVLTMMPRSSADMIAAASAAHAAAAALATATSLTADGNSALSTSIRSLARGRSRRTSSTLGITVGGANGGGGGGSAAAPGKSPVQSSAQSYTSPLNQTASPRARGVHRRSAESNMQPPSGSNTIPLPGSLPSGSGHEAVAALNGRLGSQLLDPGNGSGIGGVRVDSAGVGCGATATGLTPRTGARKYVGRGSLDQDSSDEDPSSGRKGFTSAAAPSRKLSSSINRRASGDSSDNDDFYMNWMRAAVTARGKGRQKTVLLGGDKSSRDKDGNGMMSSGVGGKLRRLSLEAAASGNGTAVREGGLNSSIRQESLPDLSSVLVMAGAIGGAAWGRAGGGDENSRGRREHEGSGHGRNSSSAQDSAQKRGGGGEGQHSQAQFADFVSSHWYMNGQGESNGQGEEAGQEGRKAGAAGQPPKFGDAMRRPTMIERSKSIKRREHTSGQDSTSVTARTIGNATARHNREAREATMRAEVEAHVRAECAATASEALCAQMGAVMGLLETLAAKMAELETRSKVNEATAARLESHNEDGDHSILFDSHQLLPLTRQRTNRGNADGGSGLLGGGISPRTHKLSMSGSANHAQIAADIDRGGSLLRNASGTHGHTGAPKRNPSGGHKGLASAAAAVIAANMFGRAPSMGSPASPDRRHHHPGTAGSPANGGVGGGGGSGRDSMTGSPGTLGRASGSGHGRGPCKTSSQGNILHRGGSGVVASEIGGGGSGSGHGHGFARRASHRAHAATTGGGGDSLTVSRGLPSAKSMPRQSQHHGHSHSGGHDDGGSGGGGGAGGHRPGQSQDNSPIVAAPAPGAGLMFRAASMIRVLGGGSPLKQQQHD